jgi:CIC family chloride channel protein
MKILIKYLKVNFKLILRKVLAFFRQRVEFKTFIILSSIVVGITSGLAAVLLKNIVHFFQQEPTKYLTEIGLDYLLPFTPLLGIILSIVVVKLFFDGKMTTGLSNVIYTILRKSSDVPKRDVFSHLITSGITIGFGGSAGLEAPIVVTGAAIGSNAAKEVRFNYQTRTLLLACGSAAGISAIFNSPIAGVIFAFEVLLPEFSIASFIPLLIASASSAVLSKFLYSGQLFYLVTKAWQLEAIPYYIILGILSGFISLYMIKITHLSEKIFDKYSNKIIKALAGGLILCLLIFFIPPLYGEGYNSVMNLLSGKYDLIINNNLLLKFLDMDIAIILFAILIVFSKVIATSLTLNSGGNGGIIAPSLFTGAFTGFLLANLMKYFGIVELNHPNFIAVGMAGILSGVLHSPLTGIFLIAEVTGGYNLIVPLMIVSALSFFISRYFHPYSIYTAPLARKGIEFRSEKEKYFIQQININDLVETDFLKIHPNMTIGNLLKKISATRRNIFPVIDDKENLLGVITLDDVREVMLHSEVYNVLLAYEIMNPNFYTIELNSDINKILEIFEEKSVWNVAVTRQGKYMGFISKSNLFNKYFSALTDQESEKI